MKLPFEHPLTEAETKAIDEAVSRKQMIGDLDRAARSLRGTANGSHIPDSLGDEMVRCSIFISSHFLFPEHIRSAKLVENMKWGRDLLARFRQEKAA